MNAYRKEVDAKLSLTYNLTYALSVRSHLCHTAGTLPKLITATCAASCYRLLLHCRTALRTCCFDLHCYSRKHHIVLTLWSKSRPLVETITKCRLPTLPSMSFFELYSERGVPRSVPIWIEFLLTGVICCLTLGIIEICRGSDDSIVDFLVQILVSSLPHFDEDH